MTIDYGTVFLYDSVLFLALNADRLHRRNRREKGDRDGHL
jgi:hypothetical protein